MFLGALNLPPLGYYKEAIKRVNAKRVVIVAEPIVENRDPCDNPLPELIKTRCLSLGLACHIQSSDCMQDDASTLFYAKKVIASNSAFSKMLPSMEICASH